MKKEVVRFENLTELGKIVKGMDRAVQFPVFYKNSLKKNELTQAKNHSAVYNVDRQRIAQIMSDEYTVLQHQDAFGSVVDALKTLNAKVHGKVVSYNGDLIYLYGTFNDVIVKDDAKGMEIGFRITNSYNMWTSFSGSAYTFRLICSNGAILKKMIPEAKFSKKHYGQVLNYKEDITQFITKLIESVPALEAKISLAMADTVEWKLVEKLLPKLVLIKKHKDEIEKRLKEVKSKKKQISRWDIYNCFTNYATHGEKISAYIENLLSRKAEQILMMKDLNSLASIKE